ncbi:MAG: ribonuclease HI [Anaerolineae bacterium]|nr:ribonuclease HI [Anaerolineae bacterium]
MADVARVTIFTDGGAAPNPGPGGYGVLMIFPDRQQELSGGEADTTNNRMELTAACVALEALTDPHDVTLYTDSEYLKKGITQWIAGWVRKGWKDVKNPDLWQRLYRATLRHEITWKWVKGHAGHEYNERVDQLATAARNKITGKKSPEVAEPVKTTAPAATFDYTVYTATAYDRASKAGAWAVVIQMELSPVELTGTKANTSEYELALIAAVQTLETLPGKGSVVLHTESENVQKGAATWIKGWRKNGWQNSQGKPIAHQELWQRLDKLLQQRTVSWKLAAGASLRANELATQALRGL